MAMTAEEQAAFDATKKSAEDNAKALAEINAKMPDLEARAKAADEFKADMFKYKEEKKAAETAKAEAEKKSLLEKEQYKTLFEKTEAEKKVAEEKATSAINTVDTYIKTSALEAAAMKAGVKPEAMVALKRLTDLDKLEVKKEGSEIKVNGLETLMQDQIKLHPYLFGKGAAPNFTDVRGGGGGGNSDFKELTVPEIMKLEKTDKVAYRKYMEDAQKAQIQKTVKK